MSFAPGGTPEDFIGPDWRDSAVEAGWIDPDDMPGGVNAIWLERERQQDAEGWTDAHDDQHTRGQMACAAACYALGTKWNWPGGWSGDWWKPSEDRRRNLVKAGALIAAEIDRLDRLSDQTS